jgi:hypothetical protein
MSLQLRAIPPGNVPARDLKQNTEQAITSIFQLVAEGYGLAWQRLVHRGVEL